MLVKLIKMFCEEKDGLSFTSDYSGRFMYGDICIGIILDENQDEKTILLELMVYILENMKNKDPQELLKELGTPKTDSFGKGTILYFPKLKGYIE